MFISHHVIDGYIDKKQWTIKTLVREAVNSDSPEATKGKGIQQHTDITGVAYRFKKKRYLHVVILVTYCTVSTCIGIKDHKYVHHTYIASGSMIADHG